MRSLAVLLCLSLCACTSYAPARWKPTEAPLATPGFTSRAAPPAVAPTAAADDGPLTLTSTEAALRALSGNRSLKVERYRPEIARTAEEAALAPFDPLLSASASRTLTRDGNGKTSNTGAASAKGEAYLDTGTTLEAGIGTQWAQKPVKDQTRLHLTATQALLRGFGREANLAAVLQAALDTSASAFELKGFAQELSANAAAAYWNYLLALRRIEIVNTSLAVAKAQRDDTIERIRVGTLAEIEKVAAEAEVASREEARIDAESQAATAKITLLRLLGEEAPRELACAEPPAAPPQTLDDPEDHVKLALASRPDLAQARLELERGDLELVKTKNGLLPKLDAFLTLGKSGYSDSFGGMMNDLDGKGYDASVGVTGELPWRNRAARADERRARLTRAQAEESLKNLESLARADVRSAHIEARRQLSRIDATAATRRYREETFEGERAKFRAGRSTNLLVSQAERDLLESRLAELDAQVSFQKALTDLYRKDGSLLTRLGIRAPGEE